MSLIKICTSIFLLFIPMVFFAQAGAGSIIESINFYGANKTKTTYLQNIIECRAGEIIDESMIQEDVQKLKNFSGIGNANYHLDTLANGIHLNFEIIEVATFLPIVNFGGIKDNLWFQLGFVDINWIGKGQQLSAYYQNNDRRHTGQLYYRIPFFKSTPWGFSASLTKWASREPLFFGDQTVFYDYDNNSAAISVSKNFGTKRQRSIELGGTYFIETYNKSKDQNLEETPGPISLSIPKFLTKLEYKTNKLNYHFFYLDGYEWFTTFQNVYNSNDGSFFNSLLVQGRRYLAVGKKKKANLAFRAKAAIASNIDSPFAPFVADSHLNLRGVGNRISRGTAEVVLNAEYRYTVFHKKQWAGQVVTFVDMGSWRNPGGQLKDIFDSNQFRQFVGGGVRVINNKIFGAVLRIDYGVNLFNTREKGFVLGLGQYF